MMRRLRACAVLAAPLLLAACGGDAGSGNQAGAQQVAQGQGADGSLLSVAQAQQAAQQWWNDHEQALLKRDGTALAHVDAAPLALTEVELLRAAISTHQGILAQARQPSAVRVHVPAQQSWPVPVLAVYDVAGQKGGTAHVAVMLMKLNPGAAPIATETAELGQPEPAFDTDAAGYVRMGPATTLSKDFAAYMEDVVHATPAPSPAPVAPGKRTSDAAAADAALLHDPGGHSHGSLSTVDIDYSAIAAAAPVFELAGNGGGFTLIAVQRSETLHPMPGQALNQDPQRHNYGIDLAPGQYPQIGITSVEVLAVTLPPGGAPAVVDGGGGGVAQEG